MTNEPVHTSEATVPQEPCGFLGCPTVIAKTFPWSMCGSCRNDAD